MTKKTLFAILLFSLLVLPFNGIFALSEDDAHKAIVKIYSYHSNSDYFLELMGSGSGVILNNSGAVLTNYHVVSKEDSFGEDVDVALLVCLTGDTGEEPDCSYTANVIEKDEATDMALLKIKSITELTNKTIFSYLERATLDSSSEGDEVRAIGYPAIGSETLTTTSGIISGSIEKYDKNWLKTDAKFSYGSSGGALIDSDGNLLGITTQAHADMLGSLGYVVDITEVNEWIENNINKSSNTSALNLKLVDFMLQKDELENTQTFTSSNFGFSITKENDWEFDYSSENELTLSNPGLENGGFLGVTISEF